MSIIVGIDPGLSGGIAWLDHDPGAIAMPVLDGEPDLQRIERHLLEIQPRIVCIEMPEAMPGQSSRTTMTSGVNWGQLVGYMRGKGIPYTTVRASSWKAKMGLIQKGAKLTPKQKKEIAIAECRRLFPHVDLLATPKSRTYHDGMAEALLIAEYARRHLNL